MGNFFQYGSKFVVKSDISIIESCTFTEIPIPCFYYQETLPELYVPFYFGVILFIAFEMVLLLILN